MSDGRGAGPAAGVDRVPAHRATTAMPARWRLPAALDPPWLELTPPVDVSRAGRRHTWLSMLERMLAALVVLGLVAIAGAVVARAVADQEAISEAIGVSDVLARSAIEPVLSDDILSPKPETSAAALARVDEAVRAALSVPSIVRVKLWTPDGRVIYSDEPRLIGQRFPLADSERQALLAMTPIADVSDLAEAENQFERDAGRLLEVYRPVHTPSGRELLFETYLRYGSVGDRSERILAGFAALTLVSLLLTHLVYAPLSLTLARRSRRLQRRLDQMAETAAAATDEERRRIAGALHDGVVQDLAAASLIVAGAAEEVRESGQPHLVTRLEAAAAGVRSCITALRSVVADIYPPNLRAAGLGAALQHQAKALRGKGINVEVVTDGRLDVDPTVQLLLYRVAQECLRNADRHARATRALVQVSRHRGRLRLDIADDGVGFDPVSTLTSPNPHHFGVRVMRDLATHQGARLAVRTAPGAGTRWRLEVATGA